MSSRVQAEQHIEVHKFYGGATVVTAFLALVLQAFLNKYGSWAGLLELPLLVTIYFSLSRRNPATGLLLGAGIGILQDAVSHMPIGYYGIAKTFVGYVASSLGARIDTEHPVSRFGLVIVFFHFHQAILTLLSRVLLDRPATYFSMKLFLASLVNAAIAVVLFPILDHLRKPN
ncbi:MAG: rod shape-determining protein MreD [Candidatus Acidiferrales bacterium]